LEALQAEMIAHRNERPSAEVLQDRLTVYQQLLDKRPSEYDQDTLQLMGYYGPERID
jgi:hypothetical protein